MAHHGRHASGNPPHRNRVSKSCAPVGLPARGLTWALGSGRTKRNRPSPEAMNPTPEMPLLRPPGRVARAARLPEVLDGAPLPEQWPSASGRRCPRRGGSRHRPAQAGKGLRRGSAGQLSFELEYPSEGRCPAVRALCLRVMRTLTVPKTRTVPASASSDPSFPPGLSPQNRRMTSSSRPPAG